MYGSCMFVWRRGRSRPAVARSLTLPLYTLTPRPMPPSRWMARKWVSNSLISMLSDVGRRGARSRRGSCGSKGDGDDGRGVSRRTRTGRLALASSAGNDSCSGCTSSGVPTGAGGSSGDAHSDEGDDAGRRVEVRLWRPLLAALAGRALVKRRGGDVSGKRGEGDVRAEVLALLDPLDELWRLRRDGGVGVGRMGMAKWRACGAAKAARVVVVVRGDACAGRGMWWTEAMAVGWWWWWWLLRRRGPKRTTMDRGYNPKGGIRVLRHADRRGHGGFGQGGWMVSLCLASSFAPPGPRSLSPALARRLWCFCLPDGGDCARPGQIRQPARTATEQASR